MKKRVDYKYWKTCCMMVVGALLVLLVVGYGERRQFKNKITSLENKYHYCVENRAMLVGEVDEDYEADRFGVKMESLEGRSYKQKSWDYKEKVVVQKSAILNLEEENDVLIEVWDYYGEERDYMMFDDKGVSHRSGCSSDVNVSNKKYLSKKKVEFFRCEIGLMTTFYSPSRNVKRMVRIESLTPRTGVMLDEYEQVLMGSTKSLEKLADEIVLH